METNLFAGSKKKTYLCIRNSSNINNCFTKASLMVEIGKEIEIRLKQRSLPVSWLADEISCSRANVYKILKKKSIDTDLLVRISKAMDFDFFSIYSVSLLGRES